MLLESDFLNQFPFMFHIKNQTQPIPVPRPAVVVEREPLPLGGEVIINEAGKCSVKAVPAVQALAEVETEN
jgi:hypothetical protein